MLLCRSELVRVRAAYTTKADFSNNMGTVAKSGTTYFLEAMAEGASMHLIVKFGVGFYSAFLVASRAAVTFKGNVNTVQNIWEPSADASLRVAPDPCGNILGRGSRCCTLKDGRSRCSKDRLHHC